MSHYTKDLPGTEILIGLIATKNTQGTFKYM